MKVQGPTIHFSGYRAVRGSIRDLIHQAVFEVLPVWEARYESLPDVRTSKFFTSLRGLIWAEDGLLTGDDELKDQKWLSCWTSESATRDLVVISEDGLYEVLKVEVYTDYVYVKREPTLLPVKS